MPNAVSLHAFVKPEGERLHLLIRVPLVLLGTLDLPRRGPAFIDLSRIDKHLELAAATCGQGVRGFARMARDLWRSDPYSVLLRHRTTLSRPTRVHSS